MNRPVTVTMITLAAVLFGVVALLRLPLNLLPDITYPTLTIRTEYRDAAPAEVEKLVTEPLEEAVSVIQGLRNLRSDSRAGVSEITLEFAWKTDMDYAGLDVREKIDLVDLPEDVESPVLLRYDPSLDPILRIGLYGEKDLVTLRYLGERILKKELESLEGVASVRVRGGLEEEIHVEVDEGKLAAMDIPIDTIGRFLDSQNVNAAGGRLRDRDAEFLVRAVNEFAEIDDIGEAILFEEQGRQVRVKDVGSVKRGFKERQIISRVRGQEAVELALYKEGNANTVQVARSVERTLDRIQKNLPGGVHAEILFDQSTFIEQALGEVLWNALIGGGLAVLILFLFLREKRSTAIIGAVIPLSVVATFFVMQQLAVSLNIMSLGGLALGVGMLVDNAIVVLESVNRHRREGLGAWEATLRGGSEVSRAVIASTLTTVAVFLPIIFVEGIAGQIFKDQALTVTSSLLISLLAALTLIPVLASIGTRKKGVPIGEAESAEDEPVQSARHGTADAPSASIRRRRLGRAFRIALLPIRWILLPLLRAGLFVLRWFSRIGFVLVPGLAIRLVRVASKVLARFAGILFGPLQWLFDRIWVLLPPFYDRQLSAALRNPRRTLLFAGLMTLVAVLLVPGLGIELVPPFSQGEFSLDLEMPPGTPLSGSDRVVRELEDRLVSDPRIGKLFASIGESPDLGSAALMRRENIAQLNVAIADPDNKKQELAVIKSLREKLAASPDIKYTLRRPTYFSFKTPIEVHVYGHELEQLDRYSRGLATAMQGIEGLQDVRSTLEEGSPEVQISFRRERLSALDLDLESVSRTLRNKIRGDVATRLKERDRQLDILVRSAHAEDLDAVDVGDLVVSQREGVPIPLSAVADVAIGTGPSQITHIGQQRAAVIRADLTGRDLGSASDEINELLKEMPPPPTLAAALGGQKQEVTTSFRSLALAVFLAIFMVYLVMASQFESFLHPLVILFSVPLGLVGAILALAVTRTSVSVVVLIGVVMLTGIVVNNAIVLVDFINQRRRAGRPKLDAIREAAQARLRPILMTTLTTVLALLPMGLGFGQGAELRAPMAIAVIGGLGLSTLLTLLVIPVVYTTLDRSA